MSELTVQLIPALADNYAYWLLDEDSGQSAVVDPSEADPVLKVLAEHGGSLDFIINTHHHWDHTGGNEAIKDQTGCQIVGSRLDRDRIPGLDIALGEGDLFELGHSVAQIYEIPGHTHGHIALWFPEAMALFSGDTLFTLGCGRVFEGTYGEMWESLDKLRNLPAETRVYCGHEYTLKNARFALTVDPDNEVLQARQREAETKRARGEATVPATIEQERLANPFLRPESTAIRSRLDLTNASTVEVFAALRQAKDRY